MRIFLSYRRSDTRAVAGRIFDRLRSSRVGDAVFFDISALEPGSPFPSVIEDSIAQSDVMLVIIGQHWTGDTPGAETGGRLAIADDFVRREIELGLQHGCSIVPVLIDDAVMPSVQSLPGSITQIATLQAARIRHEEFDPGFDHLARMLDRTGSTLARSRRWAWLGRNFRTYFMAWVVTVQVLVALALPRELYRYHPAAALALITGMVALYAGMSRLGVRVVLHAVVTGALGAAVAIAIAIWRHDIPVEGLLFGVATGGIAAVLGVGAGILGRSAVFVLSVRRNAR